MARTRYAKPQRLALKEGSLTWRVQIRLKGRRAISECFPTKEEAAQWARTMGAQLRKDRRAVADEAMRTTVGTMLRDYASKLKPDAGRIAQLRWWDEELGKLLISEVDEDRVRTALERVSSEPGPQGRPRGPATVNRYQAALSAALTKTYKWQKPNENPCRGIAYEKEPRGRNRWLTDEERAALLEACHRATWPGLPVVTVLALGTGCRKGELTSLLWEQIHGDAIHLATTKSGDSRTIPLVGPAKAALEAWGTGKVKRGLVFPAPDGKRPMNFDRQWLTAVKRAGLADFRFHDLRHSSATYLIQAGASTVVGKMAIEAKVLTWTPQEVDSAVSKAVEYWLSGDSSDTDMNRALEQVRAYIIENYGLFPLRNEFCEGKVFGWRDIQAETVLLTPKGFRKATEGFDAKSVAAMLMKEGFLEPGGGGKHAKLERIKSMPGPTRVYCLRMAVIGEGHDD